MNALFDTIGRGEGIARLMRDFYQRLVSDPELAPFFSHADVSVIERKQRLMLEALTLHAERPERLYVQLVHAPLVREGMSSAHVERFVAHFSAALDHHHVGHEVREQLEFHMRELGSFASAGDPNSAKL